VSRQSLMTMTTPKSITEFHFLLTSKKATLPELISHFIANSKTQHDRLNLYITTTFDQALEKAKTLQQQLDSDPDIITKLPLFGIPIAYKDLFLTKGIRTTAGAKLLDSFIPPYSATVVDKLEAAGAISLGKLNLDAWAHGASGENSDYGPTRNPHGTDYTPGGSSSASAAAVASGCVLVSTGTDTGGSIRLPANFCGIVGLKPTYGRVSRYGIIAMSSSLDSVGHFTNNVSDSATVLSVTSGADPHDANTSGSKTFQSSPEFLNLKDITLGIPREYIYPVTNSEVKDNFADTVSLLKKAGANIVELSLPHTEAAIAVYYILQPAEVSSNLARFDGIRFGRNRSHFSPEAVRRQLIGTFTLSSGYYDAYYKTAQKVRTLIKQEFDAVFSKVDALITPVSPTPPFKIGEKVNDPVAMYLSDVFTVTANIAGISGLAIPTGKTADGLPLGIQLLGPRFGEETIYPIASQLEQLLHD